MIFPPNNEKLAAVLELKTKWRWNNVIFTDDELRFEC